MTNDEQKALLRQILTFENVISLSALMVFCVSSKKLWVPLFGMEIRWHLNIKIMKWYPVGHKKIILQLFFLSFLISQQRCTHLHNMCIRGDPGSFSFQPIQSQRGALTSLRVIMAPRMVIRTEGFFFKHSENGVRDQDIEHNKAPESIWCFPYAYCALEALLRGISYGYNTPSGHLFFCLKILPPHLGFLNLSKRNTVFWKGPATRCFPDSLDFY